MPKKQINYDIKKYFDMVKKEQKVTSKDIADAIGVSRQTMSAMSGCLDQVTLLQAAQIAGAMNLPIDEFIWEILWRSSGKNPYSKDKK